MFLIPLIAFPFLVALAAYRLWILPRRYLGGGLRLARPGFSAMSLLTGAAYLGLLVYTVGLLLLSIGIGMHRPDTVSGWLADAPPFALYPVAYIAAEWVFYYGFARPQERQAASV